MSPKAAYVTLLTGSYLPGTLVLDQTLRSVGSQYPLVVLITPQLPQDARDVLEKKNIIVKEVETLQPEEGIHKLPPEDIRFAQCWTKLRSVDLATYEWEGS